MLKGIDVSSFQGDINFQKVKADGIDFVIIYGGMGRLASQKSTYFEKNYQNARSAGLKIGAYWYSYAKSAAEAELEAKACIAAIGSFSLNPPSIPHFSVDWYKKAMSGGMILKDATIFGQSGGTLLGGGEAGDEAVVGVSSLRSMIQDAVQGAALSLSGDQPLINIEEMSVRSDDDIRKISQQLNTLLNAGRRAKGYI